MILILQKLDRVSSRSLCGGLKESEVDGGRDARNLPFWQPGGRSSLPGSMDDSTKRPFEVEATKDEEGRGVRIFVGVNERRTSNTTGED